MGPDRAVASTEHTVRRSHNAVPYNGGYGWCRAIENTINALGLPVLLETAATKLHRNAEGRVIGAQAMDLNTGDVINVKATKGVLLSTNHVGCNMKGWAYYSPISRYMMEHSELCGSPYPLQILGDGPRMLDEVDGYQYPLQSLYGGDCVKVSERGAGLSCFCHRWGNDASIWLNKQGKRWGKETFYEYYTERTWRDNDPKCYYELVDDEFVKSDVGQENLQMIISTAEKTGYTESYFCADTVEEVCEHFGIDGEQAAKTLADWNALVESGGVDEEFGRGIEEGTKMGRPINKPPYWIFAPGLSFGTAKAGGRITPKAEALDTQRNIIPGLVPGHGQRPPAHHGRLQLQLRQLCPHRRPRRGRHDRRGSRRHRPREHGQGPRGRAGVPAGVGSQRELPAFHRVG